MNVLTNQSIFKKLLLIALFGLFYDQKNPVIALLF